MRISEWMLGKRCELGHVAGHCEQSNELWVP
jgi:hypothetical protein